MRARGFSVVMCVLGLTACNASTTLPTDGGTDAPRADAGNADPCAADRAHSSSTIGCNGPVLGPAAPNELGGVCTPESDVATRFSQGSCNSPHDICAALTGHQGICYRHCDPAPTYVSTGTCPSGSRCFTIDVLSGNVFCYPYCNTWRDCAGVGGCGIDLVWGGSCVCEGAPGSDAPDSGPRDAGAADAGSTDAGTDAT